MDEFCSQEDSFHTFFVCLPAKDPYTVEVFVGPVGHGSAWMCCVKICQAYVIKDACFLSLFFSCVSKEPRYP